MAVLEEDEGYIETDFVEALSEIGGENQFSCDSCDKVCKSKGGLTRQVNSKHCDKGYKASNLDIPALTKVTKDGLCSIVNKIKLNVRNEGYWDQQITSDLKNDSLTLYNLYTNDFVSNETKTNSSQNSTSLFPHHLEF